MCRRCLRPSPTGSVFVCCPSVSTRALQVLVVGSGASLGREVAPRQFAVALGDFATGWLETAVGTGPRDLLACAAGAGLGAVYAVPLGGALFTVRIMLKSWHRERWVPR